MTPRCRPWLVLAEQDQEQHSGLKLPLQYLGILLDGQVSAVQLAPLLLGATAGDPRGHGLARTVPGDGIDGRSLIGEGVKAH